MSTREITCPDCRGEGRLIPLASLSEERCERCNGYGYLPNTERAKP